MPYKVFQVNEVLTAADVNNFFSEQVISTFASSAVRDSAIGTPVHGQFAFLTGTNELTFYNAVGTAWELFESGGGEVGAEGAILLNAGTISSNYEFPAGFNGVSAGPIVIVSGATVTVGTASAWSIV